MSPASCANDSAVATICVDAVGERLPRRAADLQEALFAESNPKGLHSSVVLSTIHCYILRKLDADIFDCYIHFLVSLKFARSTSCGDPTDRRDSTKLFCYSRRSVYAIELTTPQKKNGSVIRSSNQLCIVMKLVMGPVN